MAVPATQGKQCKYLEEMEIGDYIRCTYTAAAANAAGEFSDLGGFIDTYDVEQQKMDEEGNPVVDADGNPVMETVAKQYGEIPIFTYVSAATIPIRGYFYFLKVDKGLLVADRCVQNLISATSLNVKNYLQGKRISNGLVRLLSQVEWTRYLTNGDLNGCITKQDEAVWHVKNYPTYSIVRDVGTWNRYYLEEITADSSGGNSRICMNLNGSSYNASNHACFNTLDSSYFYIPKYIENSKVDYNGSACHTIYGPRLQYIYSNILYRPALEYVDNPNSKTIYF